MKEDDHFVKFGLSLTDSSLLSALCQFVWVQSEPLPLIFDVENEIYTKQGITLPVLKHLETIGLVIFEANGFVKKRFGKHIRLFYCGRPTKIGYENDGDNQLDLGVILLTERGKELVHGYKAIKNQEFYEYVISRWFQQGYLLSSIQVDRKNKYL